MTKKLTRQWLLGILIVATILILFYLLATATTVGQAFAKAISDSFITIDDYSPSSSAEVSHVNWTRLRNFILLLGLSSIILIALSSYLISQYILRKDRQRIATMIKNYRYQEKTQSDSKYLAITNELKQIQLANAESNEKLQEETQRTKDLITFLAHDLRTPLSSVIGYLNLLIDTPEIGTATRSKYLQISLKKAERLETLIEEFFDITRFNFQHIVINYSKFNLYHLLQQLTEEFYPQLSAKSQSIDLQLSPDLEIQADPDKLARVFNNILKNAIAYSSPNKTIVIEAQQAPGWINLNFKNNGPEIPVDKKNTIFDKFYRLDTSRNTRDGGAGLGLAIAKDIVEAHHGQIGLISNDTETVFWLKLPTEAKQ